MLREIEFCLQSPWLKDFTVYVLGQDNFEYAKKAGANAVLVDPKPFLYPQSAFYRNRLQCLIAAAQDYDEFVSLDWDCYPTRDIPADFWERLSKKAPFQAPLCCYRFPRCRWRAHGTNFVPNGGWLYFRDNTIPSQIGKVWDSQPIGDLDEVAMAYWTDNYLGGWKGPETYYKTFEPVFVMLTHRTRSMYSAALLQDKEPVFVHEHQPWN